MSTQTEVAALGYTVPVWDYLTPYEMEQLELLIAEAGFLAKDNKPMADTRQEMRTFAIFLDSRLGKKLDIDQAMRQRVPYSELALAVRALIAPFYDVQLDRVRNAYVRAAAGMTPEAIQSMIDQLQTELAKRQSESAGLN